MLNVPKSTLSGWLSNIVLPKEAQERINSRLKQGTQDGMVRLIKRNKEQTINAQNRAREIRNKAKDEIKDISKEDLLVIGCILYWAEGYKKPKTVRCREVTSHTISFTNSDPDMIKTFLFFLQENMKIPTEKIHINLRLFPHMDKDILIKYWMNVTGLPQSQFDRPSFVISRASKGIRPFNRLPHGIAQIRVGDTKEFYRLMGWIDGIKESLALFHNKV